jgi:uncharacterized protein YdeI (YjbR/CyaY-like superfamily)
MKTNKIEEYLASNKKWSEGLQILRDTILATSLTETIKWGTPVYSFQGNNILGIGAFKSYFGIWFFQGALLTDKRKVLVNAQEGKTSALRQMRFTSTEEINPELIKDYIFESIQNHKEGKEIKPTRNKPLVIPKVLKDKFDVDKKTESCFKKLSLTKKREFVDYLNEAKRETTKQNRLSKIIPMIYEGIGLHDKYKK